jgi:DNA-binding NarL/FixJ family response regulator
MQAVLFSDHPPLLAGLRATLSSLGGEVTVQRSTRLPARADHHPDQVGGVCDGTAAAQACTTDMVFVDLAWCGLPRLLRVTQGLRARLADTPVVVLLDRPEQVAQLLQAHIDADLLVAKSAAPTVVCRSVQRFLVRRPH